MRAIILAGGRGRRLLPYTVIIPKPLFPVGEKAILEIVIGQLAGAGITSVTIATGYMGELIEAYFGNGDRFGIPITYSRERTVLGTAGPISLIEDISGDFLVMNGDVLTTMNYQDFITFHKKGDSIATICGYTKEVQSSLGILEVDENNSLRAYKEKPVTKYLVSTGVYCFRPEVLSYLTKGERIDLPELISNLLTAKERIVIYEMKGKWFDIGTEEDLHKAIEFWESFK